MRIIWFRVRAELVGLLHTDSSLGSRFAMALNNTTTSNFDYDLLCSQAKSIMEYGAFRAILGLEISLAIPACAFNVMLMSIIFRLTVYHSNLRCLLFHHSLNLALYSASTMARALYILVVGDAMDRPCDLIISLYACKLAELITILPIINTIYSFITICLERLYATITYRTYDSASKVPYLVIIFIPVVWLSSLVYQLNPLPSISRDRWLPVCANLLAMTSKAATGSLAQSLVMETLALCLVVTLYLINSRKMKESLVNRAQHSLAARFQISQNMEVNSLLIPSLLAHAACFVPIIAYLILVTCGLNLDLNTEMLLIHVQYVWIFFYAIVHPLLALVKNSHFKQIYKSRMPHGLWKRCCKRKKKPVNVLTEADIHFKSLEAMWAAKYSS